MLKYSFSVLLFLSFIISLAQETITIPQRGFDGFSQIKFTPDGKYLVSSQEDINTIIIWDVKLEKELFRLDGYCPTLSPDGSLLAYFGTNSLGVFDFRTAKNFVYPLVILDKYDTNSYPRHILMAISPGLDYIAFSGDGLGSKIRLFSMAQQKIVFTDLGNFPVFSTRSNSLFYSGNRNLYTYDLVNRRKTNQAMEEEIIAMSLMPDGKNLQLLLNKSKESLWFILYDTEKKIVQKKQDFPCSYCEDDIQYHKVIGFLNDSISVFHRENRYMEFYDHKNKQKFKPDGDYDYSFFQFNQPRMYVIEDYGEFDASGYCMSDTVGSISEIDIFQNKVIQTRKLHCSEFCYDLAVSPTGKMLALGSHSRIRITDMNFDQTSYMAGLAGNLSYFGFKSNGRELIILNNHFATTVSLDRFYAQENGYCGDLTLHQKSRSAVKYDDKLYFLDENLLTTDSMDIEEIVNYRDALVRMSPDGKRIGLSGGNSIYVYEVSSRKLLADLPASCFYTYAAELALKDFDFSPSGRYIWSINKPGMGACDVGLMLFDLESKKLTEIGNTEYSIGVFDAMEGEYAAFFTPGEDFLIYLSGDQRSLNWFDLKLKKTSRKISLKESATGLVLLPGSNQFLLLGHGKISLLRLDDGKVSGEYFTGYSDILNGKFGPDNHLLALGLADNTLVLYDWKNKKKLCTIMTRFGNTLLLADDHYYAATREMMKAVVFRTGTKGYQFEQFDLQYNRPDIILERIGLADTLLIKAYRKAWHKRLKKMNVDPSGFINVTHIPEIFVLNVDSIPLSSPTGNIEVRIRASDSKYKLLSYQVSVNDVPLLGSNGASLQRLGTQHFETKIMIPVSADRNHIKVWCMNEKGAESFKESFWINCENKDSMPGKLYLIAIGVSRYQDKTMNLKYPVKDGRELASLFSKGFRKGQAGVSDVITDTLFDQKAIRENILALKEKLLKTRVDDIVILSISGHGLLDDSLNFYFATNDIDFAHPASRGLLYRDLESLLDSIPARKKLLMMDACHSGEVDTEVLQIDKDKTLILNDGSEGNLMHTSFKGAEIIESKSGIGLVNSFELMQSFFTDLSNGTGSTVISAAAGVGVALEGDVWNNGVFTYTFLQALKNKLADYNGDGTIRMDELKYYISSEVVRLTNGRQVPTTRAETPAYNWRIW